MDVNELYVASGVVDPSGMDTGRWGLCCFNCVGELYSDREMIMVFDDFMTTSDLIWWYWVLWTIG